jgi:hypothetical protein
MFPYECIEKEVKEPSRVTCMSHFNVKGLSEIKTVHTKQVTFSVCVWGSGCIVNIFLT